jgi:hypothetical protein
MFGFDASSSSDDDSCAPPPAKAARTPLPKAARKHVAVKRPPSSPPPPPARITGKKQPATKTVATAKPAPKGKRGSANLSSPEESSDDGDHPPSRPLSKQPAKSISKVPKAPERPKKGMRTSSAPSHREISHNSSNKCDADDATPIDSAHQVADSPPDVPVNMNMNAVCSDAAQLASNVSAPQKESNHIKPKRGAKKVFVAERGSTFDDVAGPEQEIVGPPPSDQLKLDDHRSHESSMRGTSAAVPAVEWFTMHYVDKVGVPYILTNGDCGIHFNDGSCMQISGGDGKLSKQLLYVNKHHHYFTVAASNESLVAIPRRLEKKLFAVLWCRQYLKGEKHAKTGVQCKQTALPPRWNERVPSDDQTDPPAFVAAVMSADGDALPEFLMSNTAKPYPNDTYYLSGDDRP